MTVYLYYGDDDFGMEQAVAARRAELVDPAFASLSHKVLNECELAEALEAIGSVSLAFGQHTLIELTNPLFLQQATKTAADDAELESFKALLEDLPDNKSVMMIAHKFDGKIKVNRWLTKHDRVVSKKFEGFKFWQADHAQGFLMDTARQQNVTITAPAAHALVTQLGVDKRTLYNEVAKLALLKETHPTITPAVVEALGYHSDNLFAMINHWLPGPGHAPTNWQQAQAHLLDDLHTMLIQRHPVAVFAPIQTYVNNIFTVCRLYQSGISPDQIAKRTKQKPFTIKKNLQQFGRISANRWQQVKHALTDLEWRMKSGQLDGQAALEVLFTT